MNLNGTKKTDQLNNLHKSVKTKTDQTTSTFKIFDMSAINTRILCLESSILLQAADTDGTCKSVGTCYQSVL